MTPKADYTSLKTVTFGDESAVCRTMRASVISSVLIFVIWGAFTGHIMYARFLHAPGAFEGERRIHLHRDLRTAQRKCDGHSGSS